MEGILYKWTNYWNANGMKLAAAVGKRFRIHSNYDQFTHGWQPRWFVLDKGMLAYYKSQEEVTQGCKGSVHLSACEIIVHPTDTLRIDIVIPYEQHFYLKAPSPHERHAWLVALGSAKAGLPPSLPKPKLEKENSSEKSVVKSKKSELRLTCDLLMKQVYDVKTASNNPDGPDIQKLDEATTLLSATCDSFIQTLEECMNLTDTSLTPRVIGVVSSPPITVLSKVTLFSPFLRKRRARNIPL